MNAIREAPHNISPAFLCGSQTLSARATGGVFPNFRAS